MYLEYTLINQAIDKEEGYKTITYFYKKPNAEIETMITIHSAL
jgi:hypothetical protein